MSIEIQAPICPYCNDDHSSLKECDIKDLKKELLIIEIENLNVGDNIKKIVNMIRYL